MFFLAFFFFLVCFEFLGGVVGVLWLDWLEKNIEKKGLFRIFEKRRYKWGLKPIAIARSRNSLSFWWNSGLKMLFCHKVSLQTLLIDKLTATSRFLKTVLKIRKNNTKNIVLPLEYYPNIPLVVLDFFSLLSIQQWHV